MCIYVYTAGIVYTHIYTYKHMYIYIYICRFIYSGVAVDSAYVSQYLQRFAHVFYVAVLLEYR